MKKIIVENWITRKLPERGHKTTLFLVTLLSLGSALYLNDLYHAATWMPASFEMVVQEHQYYRLWTSLFAHGDLEHIMSNLFLFVPFAYFLAQYFSLWLFPLIGFFLGGLINLIVVHYLGGSITIIGVSGVVYWMGATWMALSFFIDRRDSIIERFLKLSGVSVVLFFPTTFLPEVSYLSHFLGYVLGVLTGTLTYFIFKKRFLSAEVVQEIDEEREYFDWENFSVEKIRFEHIEPKDQAMFNEWIAREHIARAYVPRENASVLLVYAGEMPIGFLQTSEVKEHHDTEHETLMIEPFITDRKLLNRGLGSTVLKKFTEEHSQVSKFIADVPSSSGAAVRAFKKAGFHRLGRLMVKERY